MGLYSKTQIEAWTDDLAADVSLALAGMRSHVSPRTVNNLFDLIDASADPALQNYLGASALSVDVFGLPENLATALAHLNLRGPWRNTLRDLDGYAKTADGGSYANLRAALTALGAQIHPLAAEIERLRVSESIFTLSSDVTVVAPPAYACVRPTRVYTGVDGSWTDDTTDATSATPADVAVFASNNTKVLIGSDRPFTQVIIGLSTLSSADCGITVKYWNGTSFVTVTPTDNSVGLTKNQNIKWTLPTDWTRTHLDGSGNALADKARLYYLEITRTTVTVVTPPVATCISLVPTAIVNASGAHLGVPAATPQPPLAIVRVTATNTVVIEQISEIAYTRFREPSSGLVLRALTPIASTLDLTLPYVNQAGANGATVQTQWTSMDALDTLAVALTSTDGLRNVRTSGQSSTNTATDGVFEVALNDLRTPAV